MVNNKGMFSDKAKRSGEIGDDKEGRLPIWFDYDQDGKLDVAIASGTNTIKHQVGNFSFRDRTAALGPNSNIGFRSTYGQLIDITGDGIQELAFLKDGKGVEGVYGVTTSPFTDLTSKISVSQVLDSAVADFNGDLKTDMFVVRGNLRPRQAKLITARRLEARLTGGGAKGKPIKQSGISFKTVGEVTFTVYSAQVGFSSKVYYGSGNENPAGGDNGVVKFSLKQDAARGRPQWVPGKKGGVFIWHNPGSAKWNLQLAPVVEGSGTVTSTRGYFTVTSTAEISGLGISGKNPADDGRAPKYLQNTGDGLADMTSTTQINKPISCVSVAAGDFDNDMDVDLYLVCRGGVENIANILYENNGNGSFKKVKSAGGAEGPKGVGLNSGMGMGDSVVVADYDTDGFLDLFVTNGLNMQPLRPKNLGGPDQLFQNRGNTNHWIEIDLVGKESNRDGIGARVLVTAGGKEQLRVQNGGYHRWSQDHQRIHFGLADNDRVDVTVEWPSGGSDTHENVNANKLYKIIEGEPGINVCSNPGQRFSCN